MEEERFYRKLFTGSFFVEHLVDKVKHRNTFADILNGLTPLPLSAVLKETGREHKYTAKTTSKSGPLSYGSAREKHRAT